MEHKIIINGEKISTNQKVEIKNPYSGKIVGEVFWADEKEIELAISSSVKAFEITKKLPSYKRAEILLKIKQGLIEKKDEFAKIISLESGKPISDARTEVDRAINVYQIASEEAKRIGGELIPLDIQPGSENRSALNKRFPIGVVLGITPFNFPLNLVSHKVAPALASGNTIIIKPAPQTPITALFLGEIAISAGVPQGAFNVVPCSNEIAEKFVTDERIKMLSFTGSDRVGWHLKSKAGKKKVLLELGGNAGVIVEPDADIDYAVKRCTLGGFVYSGQVCISVQRIYVNKKIFDEFKEKFVEGVKKLKIGDPLDETTNISAMISEQEAKRAENWINEAIENGAKIITGGKRNNSVLEPTILTNTKPEMKVNCNEVFAPVVTLEPYEDFSGALNQLNNSNYGLQAGVFTKDLKNVFKAYNTLEYGGIIVNDVPTYRVDNMPYGGMRDSGVGREGIKYAIEEMTETKVLVLNIN